MVDQFDALAAMVPVQAGQTWQDEIGRVRVMAVAEGYAMCRRKGRNPFIASVDQMQRGEYGWRPLPTDGSEGW